MFFFFLLCAWLLPRLVHCTFNLQMGKVSLNWFTGFMYKPYQHNFRIIPTYVSVGKLSQCDKYWLSLVHTYIRKINLIE